MHEIIEEAATRPEALKKVVARLPPSVREGKFYVRYDRDKKVAVVRCQYAA